MITNLSRLRRTPALRRAFRETTVRPEHLMYPMFVREGLDQPEPIESMPGIHRWPAEEAVEHALAAQEAGVAGVILFGLPAVKDGNASSSTAPDGPIQKALRGIKARSPELVVATDVCVCAYTDHGHCGILGDCGLDPDKTLAALSSMALSHARAGADIVAPSAMADGQVLSLRLALDEEGFGNVAVMGYSSKFASAFYGPFREAAGSAPAHGDRSAYQHDFANLRHARRELLEDEVEGADVLMVKPGLAYLDIVRMARDVTDLPIAVYNVSGEYSMVKAAGQRGWLDERKIVLEALTAFRRAGADLILTYHALEACSWLKEF